ncbi:MAG: GNAT family N-acetyltransferase [Clostridium sp.]|uniref:GNAT family N-acetyltransferase n=1 Tax=Clostridium sp. TaxID=1506 RepID=UPI002FC6B498
MDITIKKFEELSNKELYNILKARFEVFVLEQNCTEEDCDDKDYESYHLQYIENGELVAYLRIPTKGVSYEETSIGRVLVRSKYRKKGIARDMMKIAISFIENTLGEKAIKISAQEYLVDFYSSLGFEKVSDIYDEGGIPHVKMYYSK